MKSRWQQKTLGNVAEVIAGQSPEGSFYNSSGDGLPFYQGKKEFGERFIGAPTTWTSKVTKVALEGDVLMSVRAPVGPVNFATQKSCIGRGLAAIRSGKTLDRDFLFYFLLSKQNEISGTEGAVFASINKNEIQGIAISIPQLPEQQRIVNILDEAVDGITTAKANAVKNLQNSRAIFESHQQSIFTRRGAGWVESPLAELCDIKHGFAFKSEFFTDSGEYILLTPGNFYESGGYRDRGSKQKYYNGDLPDGFILSKGDLLVAMTEQAAGLLGSPALIPESGKFLHNQRLGLVTKKPGVPWTNEFFFHVFNTRSVRKLIHDSASGVKVRHTSPTKIGDVVVSFPTSISEQHSIVSMLSKLNEATQSLESIYQQKITALDALKKSLLDQAFTGQL